jgi:hypothetical protein
MMEMGSMPGGSFPPPGVLCSVKSDHDLCSESVSFLYRKAAGYANFRVGCEQLLRLENGRSERLERRNARNGMGFLSPLACPNNLGTQLQGLQAHRERIWQLRICWSTH